MGFEQTEDRHQAQVERAPFSVMRSPPQREVQNSFDGVVCFGGLDWWYHNRGHHDLQMMREFSKIVPVLYVNSLAMRTPKLVERKMFLKRVIRKLRSYSYGFRLVRDNFAVLSVVTPPALASTSIVRKLAASRVTSCASRLGIHKPLIWINCPPAAELIDLIPHARLVYQRTDRFEAFPSIDLERIKAYDRRLKKADVTLYCSRSLFDDERKTCRQALFVDHGVDYEYFSQAEMHDEPQDVLEIPRPRVGFIGGLDPHTFDRHLFLAVASKLSDCSFIAVGMNSFPENWCDLPNVYFLGQRPYEAVASYMACSDVLIMPWLQNEWVRACNPIKLKEYLAVGRPIVSTPFDEIEQYRDFVSVAQSPNDFAAAIRYSLSNRPDPAYLRSRVQGETWDRKWSVVLDALRKVDAGHHR